MIFLLVILYELILLLVLLAELILYLVILAELIDTLIRVSRAGREEGRDQCTRALTERSALVVPLALTRLFL